MYCNRTATGLGQARTQVFGLKIRTVQVRSYQLAKSTGDRIPREFRRAAFRNLTALPLLYGYYGERERVCRWCTELRLISELTKSAQADGVQTDFVKRSKTA